jgi:hypothetical protein
VFYLNIFLSISGAKKRKSAMPTTRHTLPVSTINETNPQLNSISQDSEFSLPDELIPSIVNDIPIKSSNNQITCSIINDDDIMPVVASVEEVQPMEDLNQTDFDTSFVIADSSDCNDEKIQLDDTIPSCSSGYESSAALTNIDINNHEEEDETNSTVCSREQSSLNSPMIFSTNHKKINKKRQRYKYGKSCQRPRSITPRNLKKPRSIDDDLSLVTIVTSDQIEQHLRTLFMSSNEFRRTRTRSVKTPTRLVEEINPNNSMKTIESDTNVFDILSSSITMDVINDNDQIEDLHSPCTYNVMITNKPNKLGLTIKKVVQPELGEK